MSSPDWTPGYSNRWKNPKIRALTPLGKLVSEYLRDNPSRTKSGIYPLDVEIAAIDLGIKARDLVALLQELASVHLKLLGGRRPLIKYDGAVVWVVGMWKHAVNQSANFKNVVGFEFNRAPRLPYWIEFFELYPDVAAYCADPAARFAGQETFARLLEALREAPPLVSTEPFRCTPIEALPEGSKTSPSDMLPASASGPLAQRREEREGVLTPPPLSSPTPELESAPDDLDEPVADQDKPMGRISRADPVPEEHDPDYEIIDETSHGPIDTKKLVEILDDPVLSPDYAVQAIEPASKEQIRDPGLMGQYGEGTEDDLDSPIATPEVAICQACRGKGERTQTGEKTGWQQTLLTCPECGGTGSAPHLGSRVVIDPTMPPDEAALIAPDGSDGVVLTGLAHSAPSGVGVSVFEWHCGECDEVIEATSKIDLEETRDEHLGKHAENEIPPPNVRKDALRSRVTAAKALDWDGLRKLRMDLMAARVDRVLDDLEFSKALRELTPFFSAMEDHT